MSSRPIRFPIVALAAGAVALVAASVSAAGAPSTIQVISDSQLQAMTSTVGGVAGAPSLNTGATVPHWFGTTVNGNNGVRYGYNMVGADPNKCVGAACDVTIEADVQPLIVRVAGLTFDGTQVMDGTLNSPQFTLNDYGTTNAATVVGNPSDPVNPTFEVRGTVGAQALSQKDTGNLLQLEDATMRAQFNKAGSSNYHVKLHANVLTAVTIDVPSNQGTLLQSGRGVVFADINIQWWATRIQNLEVKADPTHLPIYTTKDVLLHIGPNIFNCCVIGFHGAGIVPGKTNGSGHGNGNQPVQTYAWATYLSPGIYALPNGGSNWALQDIHPLSHEIAEWGDDPFVNNFVQPWLTPTAPQYGCTGILETGDPVVGIGFAKGKNATEQGPNPDGSQSADGSYHPEDEAILPWFMRTAPKNTVSEATQTPSTNIGRYTFMGNLNPFPGFRQPATGC
jgi:hypothetical protein